MLDVESIEDVVIILLVWIIIVISKSDRRKPFARALSAMHQLARESNYSPGDSLSLSSLFSPSLWRHPGVRWYDLVPIEEDTHTSDHQ